MFPSTVLNMAPNAAITILFILGEILYKNVQGSQCDNPLDNLDKNKTLDIWDLLEILNSSHRTYFKANNLSENTQHGIEKSRKRTLELCFLTTCFDVTCSCVKIDTCTSLNTNTDKNSGLTTFDTSLHCMILNTRINGAKNELEKQNNTPKRIAARKSTT